MIIGLGMDLCSLERIAGSLERFGAKFAARILTPAEQHLLTGKNWKDPHTLRLIAGRFAGKEAAVKALGTGIAYGLGWQDLEILPDSKGKPNLSFSAAAKQRAEALGCRRTFISITHEKNMAAAVVVLED